MRSSRFTLFCYVAATCFVLGSSAFIKNIFSVSMIIDFIELLVLGICFTAQIKEKGITRYEIFICALYLSLFVSTFLGSLKFFTYVVYAIQAVGATFFVHWGLEKNHIVLIRCFRNVLLLVVIINFILMILMPHGFYNYNAYTYFYLLGIRIAFTPFFICLLFFSFLDDELNKNGKISYTTVGALVITYATIFEQSIATALGAITVLIAAFVYLKYRKKNISFLSVLIVYAVFFVSIVFFNIQYNMPILRYILEDVLNKDLTFDNRTYIWSAAINHFLNNPIIGTGATGGGGVTVYFQYRVATFSAHNQILDLMCEGGVVAFTFFVLMCLCINKQTNRIENTNLKRIIVSFLGGWLLLMFTEVQMTKALIFIIFAVSVNMPGVYIRKVKNFDTIQ